ncbi:MAG: pyrroline-5-carboxylate reductase [Gammaproteobacteria bacterium]|nr:pyrroline-5-carboxylate reductase [Gammaproteobacteria bacterium]
MNNTNLAFIGAGNMARSLVGGLIDKGHTPTAITVTDIDTGQLARLHDDFGVNTGTDNQAAVAAAELVVLAVKPQIIASVVQEIKDSLQQQSALIVSIAAGVREKDISRWLGTPQPVIRCMPNTPALLGAGASGLYANAQVSNTQKQLAEKLLQAAGITIWVEDEARLDAITALSGSGPAYFFLLVEYMVDAAEKLGLDRASAETLARQTAYGAAQMLVGSNESASRLRDNVTSKGGTTAAAINSFESANLREIVYKGMECAYQRSIELGIQLGEK